jgi:hypothetical protein
VLKHNAYTCERSAELRESLILVDANKRKWHEERQEMEASQIASVTRENSMGDVCHAKVDRKRNVCCTKAGGDAAKQISMGGTIISDGVVDGVVSRCDRNLDAVEKAYVVAHQQHTEGTAACCSWKEYKMQLSSVPYYHYYRAKYTKGDTTAAVYVPGGDTSEEVSSLKRPRKEGRCLILKTTIQKMDD